MHAYLVVGGEDGFVANFPGQKLAFPFVKVEDVRELNSFLKLKVPTGTVILLRDFDRSTIAAQNAFLKALEEPQEGLTFILTAKSINKVIPTIKSRCEIKNIYSTHIVESEERERIVNFINSDVGEKLKFVSKITKKEEAIKFVNDLIEVGHEEIVKLQITNYKLLEQALMLKKNLEANGNVLLQLTNFVVDL